MAFEEGTQAQWLHDVLIDQVERVVVCNVREKAPLANKDDRIDADGMSEKLRVGDLKPVFHGAPEILTLKELVRNYNNLVEDSTRVMLRIKAIYRARAIATPGVSVYRASQRKQRLAKLEGGARVRAVSLLTQLDALLEAASEGKGSDDRGRAPAVAALVNACAFVRTRGPRCIPSANRSPRPTCRRGNLRVRIPELKDC